MIIFFFSVQFSGDIMEIITQNNERVTHLFGNVEVRSDKLFIEAEEAFFYNTKGYIVIKDNLKGEIKNGNFICDSLLYYVREEKSVLKGNAVIKGKGMEFKSDIFVIEHSSYTILSNSGIEVIDTNQGFTVVGEKGEYNYSADTGFVYGNPYIEVRDSVFIYSDTFFVYRKDKKVKGKNNVRIKFSDGEVQGGKLKYVYSEGSGFISDSVKIVKGNVISTMDTLYFFGKEQGIDSLYMKGSVKMEAILEQDDKVAVFSNHGKIYIEDNKMNRIVFINKPRGIYYSSLQEE